ncbi:MAG: hypothetical protein WD266_11330 [Balneolales bacterium]
MIILHRKKSDPQSDRLGEKLADLVVAYESIDHPPAEANEDLPFIEESGRQIKGEKEIGQWLLALEEELNWQRSLSGDGCYIDPKTGRIC